MKTKYKILFPVLTSIVIITLILTVEFSYSGDDITIFCGEEDFLHKVLNKCRPGGPIIILDEQQASKLIISIGNQTNAEGLVPIITTQVTTSTQPINKIIDRHYHPTNFGNRQADEMGSSWKFLPSSIRIDMEVVNQNNEDIIDREVKESFGRIQPLYTTKSTCSNGEVVEILYGAPIIVPIKDGIYTIFDKNSVDGLLPNENGEYVLDFASFFKQEIELPENTVVISSVSETCATNIKNHEVTYYDRVIFKFEN